MVSERLVLLNGARHHIVVSLNQREAYVLVNLEVVASIDVSNAVCISDSTLQFFVNAPAYRQFGRFLVILVFIEMR